MGLKISKYLGSWYLRDPALARLPARAAVLDAAPALDAV